MAHDPRDEGTLCGVCLHRYKVDVMITDELWRRINPQNMEHLCGHCIMDGIEWQGEHDAYSLARCP